MAKVSLIDFTGRGTDDEQWHAANLLLFTKNTRLDLDESSLDILSSLSDEGKKEQLKLMSQTIPSSWEFIDVTFLISGVSRACAQQITRTRNASYAMQSQRVVNASEMKAVNPYAPGSSANALFEEGVEKARKFYIELLDADSTFQDARGIMPMATTSNLVAKYNLRAFVDLVKSRESLRTQGEYRDIVAKMKAAVLNVWPWSEPFFKSANESAISILEEVIAEIGLTTGSGPGWKVAKAIDLIRKA